MGKSQICAELIGHARGKHGRKDSRGDGGCTDAAVCGVAVVFGALAMRSERCVARLEEWDRFEWFAQGRPLCSVVGRKGKHSRGVRKRVE